jgi:hypothetical protein
MLEVFKMVQDSGGLLLGFVWVVFELRGVRRDFAKHETDYVHQPIDRRK